MKKIIFAVILIVAVISTIVIMKQTEPKNPFMQEFDTLHGTVPFNEIQLSDYMPAIEAGIKKGLSEIDDICNNPSTPDFQNTIVALENSGKDLDRVLGVFFPLSSSLTNDEMMEISMKAMPLLSDYSTTISLNEKLWDRIKYVWEHKDEYNLDAEDQMLLKTTYDSFVRNGALLEGEDRETYRKLNAELSELSTKFSQNVLKELNTYELWMTKEELAGLPEGVVEGAALAAKEKGREGEYLLTLAQPTYMAFMKYSNRRDLREKLYKMYTSRNISGEFSNVDVMITIAAKRLQLANLLGFETYADYSLEHTMAQKKENVFNLLYELRDAYRPAQQKEFAELTAFASEIEGKPMEIKPWDYSYYSNKLKMSKYDYDEEALRPYFELNNVVEGVFGLATKLYGLKFEENKEIAIYHPDVKAYVVSDENDQYIGILYTDFFPRDSKSPGAWMTDFKAQWIDANGENSRPHVSIVMNFTKPTESKPSLLTPYEVETFLHEFGHALHGLLANTKYSSLSGTNVYRDFVELPSQFNENYLTQKEFLDGFARHYQTGEAIPQEFVDKIIASSQFGAAYACLRQLNFGLLDMAWHTIKAPVATEDAVNFEIEAGKTVEMFTPIEGSMTSTTFSHIFGGGYAAGYYSYKWAEVLDADAFAKFLENGIFDRKTANEFKENVLMKGGTENPAELYRRFRGQEPSIDALLKRDGIEVSAK